MNTVNRFVLQLLEHAGRGAVVGTLLALGKENGGNFTNLNALTFHWAPVAGYGLGGFVLALLLGLASVPVGAKGSPNLVSAVATPVADAAAETVALDTPAIPDAAAALAAAEAIHPAA